MDHVPQTYRSDSHKGIRPCMPSHKPSRLLGLTHGQLSNTRMHQIGSSSKVTSRFLFSHWRTLTGASRMAFTPPSIALARTAKLSAAAAAKACRPGRAARGRAAQACTGQAQKQLVDAICMGGPGPTHEGCPARPGSGAARRKTQGWQPGPTIYWPASAANLKLCTAGMPAGRGEQSWGRHDGRSVRPSSTQHIPAAHSVSTELCRVQ